MLLKVAICDDEIPQQEQIEKFILKFSLTSGVEFKIDKYSDGNSLLDSYKGSASKYDVIFLDVEMPKINGIQTAEKIRQIPDRNVLLIYITSFPEYMQESFDVQAYQYLIKPLDYDIFEDKMKKMVNYLDDLQTNLTVMSLKSGEIVIHLEDIVCIETHNAFTTKSNLLVTTINDEHIIKGKIAEFEKDLADQNFIRVHRSVLVNLKYIRRFNSSEVELSNGKKVAASRRKITEVKEAFSKYMIVRYKK